MSAPCRYPQRRRRGLSLVEMMVSLVISVLLLTALAGAFSAAAAGIESNDEFCRASQAARVTMAHLLAQIRKGTVDEPDDSSTLRLITASDLPGGGKDLTYQWRADSGQLVLVTNDVPDDADLVLASNIAELKFEAEMGTDYNNAACVSRVCVTIVVRVDDHEVRLTGSAAPRMNLIY